MRISDWSSDVCSSDLVFGRGAGVMPEPREREIGTQRVEQCERLRGVALRPQAVGHFVADMRQFGRGEMPCQLDGRHFVEAHLVAGIDHIGEGDFLRSEEHTSELPSLMRISYAVFCLKKKK